MTVKVKDIIQYLNNLNPEAEVGLDKDGWMEYECSEPNDPQRVIAERGLFWSIPDRLVINN